MTGQTERLITHSGSFHADDLFSYVILHRIYPRARLLRTRDQATFDTSTSADIIFDVGMDYNPDRRRYDHHMRDKPFRDGGYPYSAVGLIWLWHGLDYLRSSLVADDVSLRQIWQQIDATIILPIDCADNGVVPKEEHLRSGVLSLPLLLENFNPVFDDPQPDYDGSFLRAADVVTTLLDVKIAQAAAFQRSRNIVAEALQTTDDPRLIVLSQGCDWEGHLATMDAEEVLYIVYPTHHGDWNCSAAKVKGEDFLNKKPFPEAWGGLRDRDLADATGVDDAIFCHANLFLAVSASRNGALELARQALDYDPAPARHP